LEALRRRVLASLAGLFCGLALLSSAEHRLADLDFDSNRSARVENNDRPDGDEIINRLVFFDDSTEPIAPAASDLCLATVALAESCAPPLLVVRLAESRAPPLPLSPHA